MYVLTLNTAARYISFPLTLEESCDNQGRVLKNLLICIISFFVPFKGYYILENQVNIEKNI